MAEGVYLIGAARTDFKRNLRKEGKSLRDVIVEAGRGAIADAGLRPGDVQSGVVGNFAAGLYTRQLHLGSFLTNIDESLRGIPTLHTEAACASGGVAVLTAAQQIMAGLHDVVLVVGAEQQKTMSPADGADVLGAAGDYEAEKAKYGQYLFPKLFGDVAGQYAKRYGLTERQLAQVAVKNHAHARMNPCAQTRGGLCLTLEAATTESEANPRIAPPLKISDCSQITDGAAAVVLCSERFARRFAGSGSGRPRPKLLGFGHTTDHLALVAKPVPEFPMAVKAARRAYDIAHVGPRDLQGVEVHDCFSISEIVAYELLGLAEPGQGAKLVETGATAHPAVRELVTGGATTKPPFSIPVNVGGGLLADGHPVGATGVRQVAEAYLHLTGRAGERQIEGARRMLCFNMGGSFTTAVVTIWGAEA
jgi:acetyl-CoA C-acetyltransferase